MESKLQSAEDLERRVLRLGFLPFFRNAIAGFSVEENTPAGLWFEEGVEGPWEWKGPVIRNWNCTYGKLFCGKAGYVSLQWLPDLLNYRRAQYTPAEGSVERRIYDTVAEHESLLSREIKTLCGLQRGKAQFGDMPRPRGTGFEAALTRLQMATLLVIADFEYLLDKHGNPYGWGIARYVTPEALFGPEIASCDRTPEESYSRILSHLRATLPHATEPQLHRLLRF